MHAVLLIGCCLLVAMRHFLLGSAHMIPDDRLSTNHVVSSNTLSLSLEEAPPPVLIVELPKSAKKTKKTKKQKKSKSLVKKRPPPPPGCVPLWASCRSGNSAVCCDFCAFCQCRLFRSVCYCRMGNPRC